VNEPFANKDLPLSTKFQEISFFLKIHCLFIYSIFSFDSYFSSLLMKNHHPSVAKKKNLIFLAISQ